MATTRTGCPLDCPDLCSLEVDVEDGRVARVDGSDANPLTGGFICGKVRRMPRHLYGDERLTRPLARAGARGEGRFREIGWDEALATIAAKLLEVRERRGGEAIVPFHYGGSNGWLTNGAADARLFRRLGATRCLRTLCAVPSTTAAARMYGDMPGVALDDYEHARLIVVWGCNPSATGIHLVPKIKEARERGAKLVVVDPRRIPLARGADLHLAIRPGTDMVVALAIADWLFSNGRADTAFLAERAEGADELATRAAAWPIARAAEVAGVAAADLERLAALYADASPAVIRCGWGPERNRNGGGATAAILALPAIAGKLGVRGGGFTLANASPWRIDREAAIAEPEPPTRGVNMNQIGQALRDWDAPPIELLFVYNCNPVATCPNQELVRAGLRRDDLFTVVFDQVRTDTALFADIVLPATTFFEHRELRRGYGAMRMFDFEPVVAPYGEARSNHAVFTELLARTGLARDGDPRTEDELVAAIAAASEDGASVRAARGAVVDTPRGATPVLFGDVFPSRGTIDLVPADLDAEADGGLYTFRADPATPAFPLALISPATARTVSSTFGQLVGDVPVEVHPDDAAARGIADGDPVRMWNDLGEVACRARVTADTRPGTVVLPKGLWSHSTANGNTSNALCPDTLADIGGGACFNDARVQLERNLP